MANHNSTKKSIRKIVKRTAINKNRKTRIKTYVKNVVKSVEAGKVQEANQALMEVQSELMKGVAIKLISKNTASRKISRLAKMVKNI